MPKFWFKRGFMAWLLLPLSGLYYLLSSVRRWCYACDVLKSWKPPVATIVVGNIIAGGSGKTPLTIALVNLLKENEISSGVISRGYGGERHKQPLLLDPATTPAQAGDEPTLIKAMTGVPVCVFAKRVEAARVLLHEARPDVLICDDGLQHYALGRDIEIAVVHDDIRHGNGWLLPAGPLRETPTRLDSVDFVVSNKRSQQMEVLAENNTKSGLDDLAAESGFSYTLETVALCRLDAGETLDVADSGNLSALADGLNDKELIAMPGVANPQRFYDFLHSLGLDFEQRSKPDHYRFGVEDFNAGQGAHYVVTEKDKVKISQLPIDLSRVWYTRTRVRLSSGFEQAFLARVRDILN